MGGKEQTRGSAFAKASAFAHGYGVTSRGGKHGETGTRGKWEVWLVVSDK